MSTLRVDPVHSDSDRRLFLSFPWQVYRDDPYWVPPLFSERLAFVDPERNPFFQHASVGLFLARRGGEVVGTIAAFTNRLYNEFQGVNTGFFGFFEVLEDPQAAAALLERAESWAREAGHEAILGPAQWSTNDECALLVEGFQDSPRILMTYNPPRYRNYLEAAGYRKAMDMWAYALEIEDYQRRIPQKLVRVVEKVRRRGKFHVRRVSMKRFDREVEHVKRIYNSSWARNWGFVPMTDAEIEKLAEDLRPILDPELVVVVEYEGEPIGFGL